MAAVSDKGKRAAFWASWILALMAWIILLAGVSALQQNCGASGAPAITTAGAAGYLAPVSCKKFYSFPWWIVWYMFLMMAVTAGLYSAGTVHTFRTGLMGLLAPLLILMMDTANTFLYFNSLANVTGTLHARARTTLAGAIMSSISLFIMLILVGLHDEKLSEVERRGGTGEPKGETRGGVYQPTAEAQGAEAAAPYSMPTRES